MKEEKEERIEQKINNNKASESETESETKRQAVNRRTDLRGNARQRARAAFELDGRAGRLPFLWTEIATVLEFLVKVEESVWHPVDGDHTDKNVPQELTGAESEADGPLGACETA